MRKYIHVGLLFFLLNACMLLGLNQVSGTVNQSNPYGMDAEHLVFDRSGALPDLSFLKKNDHIAVVAETNKREVVGVYDPAFKYYLKSSKMIDVFEYRYFSGRDYELSTNVSIRMDDIHRFIEGRDILDLDGMSNEYETRLINVFDYHSLIFREGLELVTNLFSVHPERISRVYMDGYTDQKEKETIIVEMMNHGFVQKHPEIQDGYENLFRSIPNMHVFTRMILGGTGLTMFMWCLIVGAFTLKFRRIYIVSKIHGATIIRYLRMFYTRLFVVLLMSMVVSSCAVFFYLHTLAINNLRCLFYMWAEAQMLIMIVLVTTLVQVIIIGTSGGDQCLQS